MHTPPSPTTPLLQQRCCHQTGPALDDAQAASLLAQLTAWDIQRAAQGDSEAVVLTRTFTFSDFHRTMAFVNAVAWVAHEQDHHPDLSVGHSRCTVNWSTHSVGGLSINDFICAARVDALLA